MGTVVRMGTAISPERRDYVLVKWDSDGDIIHASCIDTVLLEEKPCEVMQPMTEESAIMFLLSRGYTIAKGE
jgi:hypothetical protein